MQYSEIDWQQASWQEACALVARFTDRLGKRIDPGIFEAVVVLNLLGLCTIQSCEGHPDHGLAHPWVSLVDEEVYQPFLRVWEQVCALQDQARAAETIDAYDAYLTARTAERIQLRTCKQADPLFPRLVDLLDRYYESHPPVFAPTRLLVERFHPGLCRIQPAYACLPKLPEALRPHYLAQGQQEMARFTQYLKQLWQQQREQQQVATGMVAG